MAHQTAIQTLQAKKSTSAPLVNLNSASSNTMTGPVTPVDKIWSIFGDLMTTILHNDFTFIVYNFDLPSWYIEKWRNIILFSLTYWIIKSHYKYCHSVCWMKWPLKLLLGLAIIFFHLFASNTPDKIKFYFFIFQFIKNVNQSYKLWKYSHY